MIFNNFVTEKIFDFRGFFCQTVTFFYVLPPITFFSF